jgi:hypothetical protein
MNTKHTPEPWINDIDHGYVIGTKGNAHPIICRLFDDHGKLYDNTEANAARIVACVNACKNVSNEWLQENAVYALIEDKERIERREANHIALLETQRDELLKELEETKVKHYGAHNEYVFTRHLLRNAERERDELLQKLQELKSKL